MGLTAANMMYWMYVHICQLNCFTNGYNKISLPLLFLRDRVQKICKSSSSFGKIISGECLEKIKWRGVQECVDCVIING